MELLNDILAYGAVAALLAFMGYGAFIALGKHEYEKKHKQR